MPDLMMGLMHYFLFYNNERRHQSLGYITPDIVYQTGAGGGATIMDKFGDTDFETEELGQRHSTVA